MIHQVEEKSKFHIGKGRYDSLINTRYKNFTYGSKSFGLAEENTAVSPAHGTYGALLFDKRWIAKRAEIIQRDNKRCVICFREEALQVHHRQYHFIKALQQFKAPWDYDNKLLITLCENCHSRGHSKFKVPNVYL
jgi:hypothetical protein